MPKPPHGRGVGPAEEDTAMGSNHGPNRHTARKLDARDLAARTGMPYTAALRQVAQNNEPREPLHRWILTDELRTWFAGEGWRGVGYPNLWDWLDTQVQPTYECDWCGEFGDAREVDSSIVLLITAYDADLSPMTGHIGTRKYHGACKPSSIQWLQRADIPSGPQAITLPAHAKPEMEGEFELTARALLTSGHNEDEGWNQAVLLVTVRVTEDHRQGVRPWLSELEMSLRANGFGHPDSVLSTGETDWALRIVADHPSSHTPQWIALRTSQPDSGSADHLLLCALDLPAEWVAAARRDGQVAVLIGPCTAHWDDTEGVPGELVFELGDQIDPPGLDSRCGCAALTDDHVLELVDEGAFVVGLVDVVADEEPQ